MNHKYEIDLFWSSEDAAFLAEAPDLEGCMAHGATHEEALLEAQAAIELWIDVARGTGIPVPEPRARRSSRA
jgi:predicted RNase H-like HicB family nuclease